MNVMLVPNDGKPRALELAVQAADILAQAGARPMMDCRLAGVLPPGSSGNAISFRPGSEALDACDIILTIGGDGTMLHTARDAIGRQKPLLGVNTGRLGFLTMVEADELEKLRRLPGGEFTVEHRSLLRVEYQSDGMRQYCMVLNDAVLYKKAAENTIGLDIFCDEVRVSSFRGDGVVFATPTGSTAYSMSAGGPIVDARMDAILVTQLCAHVVHTPPMVFDGGRTLHAVPLQPERERVYLSCDGLPSTETDPGTPVWIQQADTTIPMIQFADADQLKSIDKKLKGR